MDIDKTMQDAFNAQIKEELYSSHLYLQMAYWCRKEGWPGFAHWLFKQSEEEREHAIEMGNFVTDRGGEVTLTELPKAEITWECPKCLFDTVMAHERQITERIYQLAEKAEAQRDRASINLVDKYVDEQVEEEATVRGILNMFSHGDQSSVAIIDGLVGKR